MFTKYFHEIDPSLDYSLKMQCIVYRIKKLHFIFILCIKNWIHKIIYCLKYVYVIFVKTHNAKFEMLP